MIESVESLASIEDPTELRTEPILHHYGSLKIGESSAVQSYGRLLGQRVARHLGNSGPTDQPCLLAAPPVHVVPSAASLLTSFIHRELLRADSRVHLLSIRRRPLGMSIAGAHYSVRSEFERERYLDDAYEALSTGQDLHGARILVINDVRVTGAQERRLAQFFRTEGVAEVHWLYILTLKLPRNPDVEAYLNTCGLASDDDLARQISRTDTTLTTRGLWHLMSLGPEAFESAIDRWSIEQLRHLQSALRSERVPLETSFPIHRLILDRCIVTRGS